MREEREEGHEQTLPYYKVIALSCPGNEVSLLPNYYADLESSLKLFKGNLAVMVSVKRCHYMVQSRVTTITELCYFLASDVTFALWVK